jgi:selT/selW/selH-like putative selenoprotein
LKPGGRGDFVVTVDGQRVWDKRKQGDEFPDEAALVASLKS